MAAALAEIAIEVNLHSDDETPRRAARQAAVSRSFIPIVMHDRFAGIKRLPPPCFGVDDRFPGFRFGLFHPSVEVPPLHRRNQSDRRQQYRGRRGHPESCRVPLGPPPQPLPRRHRPRRARRRATYGTKNPPPIYRRRPLDEQTPTMTIAARKLRIHAASPPENVSDVDCRKVGRGIKANAPRL
jgi:hypothetical protein